MLEWFLNTFKPVDFSDLAESARISGADEDQIEWCKLYARQFKREHQRKEFLASITMHVRMKRLWAEESVIDRYHYF